MDGGNLARELRATADIITAAFALKSEEGENVEYDRALLELCFDTTRYSKAQIADMLDVSMIVLYPPTGQE